MHPFLKAVFIGDTQWAWRRRIAVSGAGTMLVGILHSIFFDENLAHASMITTNCVTGFGVIMSIYVGGVVGDDHLKRMSAGQPPVFSRAKADDPDAVLR